MSAALASQLGYALLALIVGLESTGVPLPGETALITAAVLAAHRHLSIEAVIAVAAAAAITGDNVGYLLGRRYGRRALTAPGPLLGVRARALVAAEQVFVRRGAAAVFLGRFVGLARMAVAWLAGANGMPWRRFALWNAAASLIWAAAVGLVAYWLGSTRAGWIGVAGAVLLAGALLHLAVRSRSRRSATPD
jgi:membrane protein DedA with SNARE-associated domain